MNAQFFTIKRRPNVEKPAPGRVVAAQPRVLLAGADPDLRGKCAEALREEGCEIELARDGETALLKLAFTYFDLLITEWKMARLDGASLLHWLRASGNALPVVMMADVSPHELPAATQRQLFALLPVPASPGRVVATVRRALDLPLVQAASSVPTALPVPAAAT